MRNLPKPLPLYWSLCFIFAMSLDTAYAADNNTLPVATMRLEASGQCTQVRQFVSCVEANRVSQVGFELDGVLSVIHKEEGDAVNEENHQAELRAVEILYQTSDQAYVRGLIAAGERIVSTGTQRIVPQQTIRMAQRPE